MDEKNKKSYVVYNIIKNTQEFYQELLNQVAVKSSPKKIVVNIGTNDVEYSEGNTHDVICRFEETISALKKSFPTTRIYISSIFPRKDTHLDKAIEEINVYLEDTCDKTPLLTFISNHLINKSHLADEKHLNSHGLYLFLSNIRFYLFGQLQKTRQKRQFGDKPFYQYQRYNKGFKK